MVLRLVLGQVIAPQDYDRHCLSIDIYTIYLYILMFMYASVCIDYYIY